MSVNLSVVTAQNNYVARNIKQTRHIAVIIIYYTNGLTNLVCLFKVFDMSHNPIGESKIPGMKQTIPEVRK